MTSKQLQHCINTRHCRPRLWRRGAPLGLGKAQDLRWTPQLVLPTQLHGLQRLQTLGSCPPQR